MTNDKLKNKFIKIPGRDFEMLEAPVTQMSWGLHMKTSNFYFKDKPNNPAENISWNDCQEFIKIINTKSKNYIYRLPTEEEWEFCCRAGSTTDFCFGDDETELLKYAWFYKNSNNSTQEIKRKLPNSFGLYDMHGNVCEWCEDLYDKSGSDRVIRGGSWSNSAQFLRSGFRCNFSPGNRYFLVGFRLVRTSRNPGHSYPLALDKAALSEAVGEAQKALDKLKKLLK